MRKKSMIPGHSLGQALAVLLYHPVPGSVLLDLALLKRRLS